MVRRLLPEPYSQILQINMLGNMLTNIHKLLCESKELLAVSTSTNSDER